MHYIILKPTNRDSITNILKVFFGSESPSSPTWMMDRSVKLFSDIHMQCMCIFLKGVSKRCGPIFCHLLPINYGTLAQRHCLCQWSRGPGFESRCGNRDKNWLWFHSVTVSMTAAKNRGQVVLGLIPRGTSYLVPGRWGSMLQPLHLL